MPELTITQMLLIVTSLIALGIALIFATNFHGGVMNNLYSLVGLAR